MEKEKCKAKLRNGIDPCPYRKKFGDYCSLHYKIYGPTYKDENNKDENLLYKKFPIIFKEVDIEKTQKSLGINVYALKYSSNIKIYWKCMKTIDPHESYLTTPNSKTYNKYGCGKCHHESIMILDKEKVLEKKNFKSDYNPVKIGDETEEFVSLKLKETGKYKNVEKLGNIGGTGDIKITHFDNSVNYIQIKTMSPTKSEIDVYSITNSKKYPDNMLFVIVNKERDRFGLFFFSEIKKIKTLTLRFLSDKTIYKNNLYTDLKDFIEKLNSLIPNSSDKNEMSKNNRLEYEMVERFSEYCKNNDLVFNRNETNGDTVDGFINDYRIQLKFCSLNRKTNYCINSVKSAGILNGKFIKRNYEEGDFDFAIIEVGGTSDDPNKFKNNFCIIPSEKLIERRILKTDDCCGKNMFNICPPIENGKKHWSREFWNNISLLKNTND